MYKAVGRTIFLGVISGFLLILLFLFTWIMMSDIPINFTLGEELFCYLLLVIHFILGLVLIFRQREEIAPFLFILRVGFCIITVTDLVSLFSMRYQVAFAAFRVFAIESILISILLAIDIMKICGMFSTRSK